ncbi:hypothetical protein FJTKL_14100 [Diaporthe vaccinii]|uniref:Large ribosomal subunit protein P1 n=2 Tax=Diaporthe eres species complex TaxID=2972384 RepID=A0ABR4E989_9PEZI
MGFAAALTDDGRTEFNVSNNPSEAPQTPSAWRSPPAQAPSPAPSRPSGWAPEVPRRTTTSYTVDQPPALTSTTVNNHLARYPRLFPCIPQPTNRPTLTMSTAELASSYAALILADEGVEITADKLQTIIKASGNEIEPIWTSLFAKALEGKDVKDLLTSVGSGGGAAPAAAGAAAAGGADAAEAPKEEAKAEEKEESDDDMGFGLFD